MGEKDIAEKNLENYPDVFADIVNGLLFHGKQVMLPSELQETGIRAQFKSDLGQLHEQERDNGRYWVKNEEIVALIGLEKSNSLRQRYEPSGI